MEKINLYLKSLPPWRIPSAIILTVLFGLIIISSHFRSTSRPNQIVQLPPSPTATASIPWKTYKNEDFGLLIKYPNDWGIKEFIVNLPEGPETQIILSKTNMDSIKYTIQTIVTSNGVWNKLVESGAEAYQTNGFFNGVPAWLAIRGVEDARPNDSIIVKSPITNHYVSIIFDLKENDDKELIQQILSTFRFLKSTATPVPTKKVNAFCGGIMGFPCPAGFTCKLDGNYPDAGGVCIKN